MASDSELSAVALPEFGVPTQCPDLPADVYLDRIESLRERASAQGYDSFVVYGDREHFANLTYLSGYDPRFEEALLVFGLDGGRPTLIVGNEGEGYVDISPVADRLDVRLFQSFSLLGQSRGENPPFDTILRDAGVESGDSVGLVGWKYFTETEFESPETTHEVPAYLVETLRSLSGRRDGVENATRLLMGSAAGMRTRNEAAQLAQFEFAASHTSEAIRKVLFGVEPGMTEHEAVQLMEYSGLPMNCHLMLSAGERAWMGLPSPSGRTIEHGDPLTTAYGAWGSLNSRAGFVVNDRSELPADISDYVDRLVAPYFEAVVAWYETLEIGVEGRELYRAVHDRIGDPFFGVELNPGHQIHYDEWVDSPIYEGSTETIESGMALQADVIPATGTEYFMTNIEDTVAVADGDLRDELRETFPMLWDRVARRREFVEGSIGIDLAPEVLPFSNIPAYLPPYLLSPGRAMRMDR